MEGGSAGKVLRKHSELETRSKSILQREGDVVEIFTSLFHSQYVFMNDMYSLL